VHNFLEIQKQENLKMTQFTNEQILRAFPKAKLWEKNGKSRMYINGTDSIVKNNCYFENGSLVVPKMIYTKEFQIRRDGSEVRGNMFVSGRDAYEQEILAAINAA